LRSAIDAAAAQYAERFTRFYVLNEPPAEWSMGIGFVTQEHSVSFADTKPGGTSGHGRPLKSLLQYAEQTKATDSEANGENRTSR